MIHQRYQKFTNNHKSHIFPIKFQCFYVSATRWRFCKLIKNANNLSQHEVLKGTNVHEMTLRVTFGAPQFRTRFRFITLCLKYTVIHMVWRTHVRRTPLCVAFGARGRSILLGLLDHFLGHLDHQDGPGTPERPCLASVWAANGAPGCLLGPPPHGPTALRLENCSPDLTSACPRLHPHLLSSIFRRRERHAHEMARRHRAGSGDRENPTRAGAKSIPGLPVKTGLP